MKLEAAQRLTSAIVIPDSLKQYSAAIKAVMKELGFPPAGTKVWTIPQKGFSVSWSKRGGSGKVFDKIIATARAKHWVRSEETTGDGIHGSGEIFTKGKATLKCHTSFGSMSGEMSFSAVVTVIED